MRHEDFVEGYRSGKLEAHIQQYDVNKFALAGVLPSGYQVATNFYAWIWILSWIAAIPVGYFYGWYYGVGLAFLGYVLPKAIRQTNAQGLLDEALEIKELFEYAIENGVIRITDKSE